jgi:hypothetical protein
MRACIASLLIVALLIPSAVFAGLNSKKAAYQGGTTRNQDFPGAKEAVKGSLDLDWPHIMRFKYGPKEQQIFQIPYKQFVDIEYGQKAGRRVGAAVATAVLISPAGLLLLFSKKRRHFVTIGYLDAEGAEQVAVFELGKDLIRTALPILETRSGKKIIYQDDEARKSGKGDHPAADLAGI